MFEILRRQVVGTIIKLSNVDAGGTWELVNVREEALVTTMEFHLRTPWGEITGPDSKRSTRNVIVTISALEEPDPDATQLLTRNDYADASGRGLSIVPTYREVPDSNASQGR